MKGLVPGAAAECPEGARRRALPGRQRDRERRAVAGLAVHRHRAAVRFDDGLHQAETETEAPLSPAAVAAEEALPDARDLIGGNPGAGVANAHHGPAVVLPDLDAHGA